MKSFFRPLFKQNGLCISCVIVYTKLKITLLRLCYNFKKNKFWKFYRLLSCIWFLFFYDASSFYWTPRYPRQTITDAFQDDVKRSKKICGSAERRCIGVKVAGLGENRSFITKNMWFLHFLCQFLQTKIKYALKKKIRV